MEYARRPPELNSGKAMDLNWRNWKQQFIAFLKVSGLSDDQPEVHKTSLLLNLIGPVGQQDFEKLTFDSPSDKENMDIILEKFDEYYDPAKSEAEERNIFFSTKKKHRESIDQYVNELKIKAKTCNFGELTDSLIRDKIILETSDKALRKHLLSEPDLNLSQTMILWQTHADTVEKVMQARNFEKQSKNESQRARGSGDRGANVRDIPSTSETRDHQAKKENSGCRRCGTRHAIRNCPAWGKKCENCNSLGHFVQFCQIPATAKNNSQDNRAAEVNRAQQQRNNSNDASFAQNPVKAVQKEMAFRHTYAQKPKKSSKDQSPDCCIA